MTGNQQAKSAARLSSGFRINSAADDAAGLGISEKMRAQIRGLDQASRNGQDGISLIQTAEGAMSTINEMVVRIRELVIQAANDTNAQDNSTEGTAFQGDRARIQDEINQLLSEIDATVKRTEFNTRTLLDGSLGGGVQGLGLLTADQLAAFDDLVAGAVPGPAGPLNAQFTAIRAALGHTPAGTYNTVTGAYTPGTPVKGTIELATEDLKAAQDAASAILAAQNRFHQDTFVNELSDMIRKELASFAESLNVGVNALTVDQANAFLQSRFGVAQNAFVGTSADDQAIGAGPGGTGGLIQSGGNQISASDAFTAFLQGNNRVFIGVADINATPPVSTPNAFMAGVRDSMIADLQLDASNDGSGTLITDWGTAVTGLDAINVSDRTTGVGQRVADAEAALGTALANLANARDAVDAWIANLKKDDADFSALYGVTRETMEEQFITGGAASNAGPGNALWFQIGANPNQGVHLSIEAVDVNALANRAAEALGEFNATTNANGLREGFNVGDLRNESAAGGKGIMLEHGEDIQNFVVALDAALAHVTAQRSNLGAMQNRLEFTIENLDISSENLQAAESRVRDADMAKEMMRFTQSNVLQQAAISMLAQANQAPQSILQLLG